MMAKNPCLAARKCQSSTVVSIYRQQHKRAVIARDKVPDLAVTICGSDEGCLISHWVEVGMNERSDQRLSEGISVWVALSTTKTLLNPYTEPSCSMSRCRLTRPQATASARWSLVATGSATAPWCARGTKGAGTHGL